MKAQVNLTEEEVRRIANLAKLPLTDEEVKKFREQLSSVLSHMAKIQSLDTSKVTETSQVTGLENVFREDVVDKDRLLSQKDALANAKNTHKGYFVVPAIFE